jgi:hypothetical protein
MMPWSAPVVIALFIASRAVERPAHRRIDQHDGHEHGKE